MRYPTKNPARANGETAAPRRKKRTAATLAAAGSLAAGMVVMASAAPSGASSGSTVQLTLGYAGGANIDPYYNQILAAAAKALPNIKVTTVVYPTYDEQLDEMTQQVAAGTIPNIIVWDNSAPVTEYADQKALMPLSSLVSKNNVNLSVDPSALVKAWTINDQLYGIPSYLQNSAYVYNVNMLHAAHINSLPTSMAQVAKDAEAVKADTGQAGLVILDNLFHLTQYVLAFGGGWGFGKTIDSPQNVAGIQFLVNLFKQKAAIIPSQVGASWDGVAVADSQAAMADGGPWYIGFMAATAPKVDYVLKPIPTSSGNSFVVTYGGAYSVTAGTKDPAAAVQLIKFLTNDASEKAILTSGLGFVPAETKYIHAYRTQTPEYDAITDSVLGKGRTLDYPPQTTQFGNALQAGFEAIIFRNQGTVSGLLSSLQKQYGSS